MNRLFRYATTTLKILKKAIVLSNTALCHALYRLHGVLHETVTVKTRQGRLTIPTRDIGIGPGLFCDRQYEYDSSLRAIWFLKEMGFVPHKNLCMLDIGANIGFISTGLLLANEVDRAIAIEPDPSNFALLIKNMEQNRLSERMVCLQMAVADRAATLTMELSPINLGDHRIRSTPAENTPEIENESSRHTVQVKSLSLGQILKLSEIRDAGMSVPSLLWIDVQGYEGYVFAGGEDVLSVGLPTVSEIWPYGIRRAGMSLEKFVSIVSSIWSDYWIERRERLIRYPISVFDRYLDELGNDDHYENVIFTKGGPPSTTCKLQPTINNTIKEVYKI